jgi:hypothetical protein
MILIVIGSTQSFYPFRYFLEPPVSSTPCSCEKSSASLLIQLPLLSEEEESEDTSSAAYLAHCIFSDKT